MEKQATEQRRTSLFLKFALGKREEKSETEIKQEMSQRSYNPLCDPLMPRLFRKVSHQNSVSRTMVSSLHQYSMVSSKEVSIYDNSTS